jgi:hypothetical protein
MDYSYNYNVNGAWAAIWTLFVIAFYVVVVIGLWKTFVKAGHPGWAAIIPFYNLYIWVKIAGKPTSWFWIMLVGALLSWIPIIGWLLAIAIWVMSLFLALAVARNFGQGTGFGILLWLFAPIMYLVLGFGNFRYQPAMQMAGGGYAAPPPPPPYQPAGAPQPLAPPVAPAPLTPPPTQAAPPPPPPAQAAPPVAEPPAAMPPMAEPPVASPPAAEPPVVTPPAPEPPAEPPAAPPEPPTVPPAPPTT